MSSLILNPYRYAAPGAGGFVPDAPTTRGPVSTSTSTNSVATQTTTFWSPVELEVFDVIWDIGAAGTYEVRVGGVLLGTTVLGAAANAGVSVMGGAAPFRIPANTLTALELRRVSGAAGWRFRSADSWVDSWYHSTRWDELAPAESVPVRLSAAPQAPYTSHAVVATAVSGSWAAVTYTLAWVADELVAGLAVHGTVASCEVLIDGVSQGAATVNGGSDVATPGRRGWIHFATPFLMLAGVTYTIKIQRTALAGALTGIAHKTATSHTDSRILLQTAWQEPGGGVVACPIYDLITA